MYSRTFCEGGDHLPPKYNGTALRREPPPSCECEEPPCAKPEEPCPPPSCPEGAPRKTAPWQLHLPYGIRLEDLLLLGLAILLWLEECEDEYLPFLLLFLLLIH